MNLTTQYALTLLIHGFDILYQRQLTIKGNRWASLDKSAFFIPASLLPQPLIIFNPGECRFIRYHGENMEIRYDTQKETE